MPIIIWFSFFVGLMAGLGVCWIDHQLSESAPQERSAYHGPRSDRS